MSSKLAPEEGYFMSTNQTDDTTAHSASCWGYHLSLDLAGCPKEKIASADNIKSWVKELVRAIEMKAYGEPQLEHFATHSYDAAGYTLTQLIETSNICAHFAENKGEAYIDIFSCKEFSPETALRVCGEYFSPQVVTKNLLERGDFKENFSETLYKDSFQGFQIEEVLHDSLSEYQSIKVLRSKALGNVLVLDGVIQTTERDEASYHEMLTHVPLSAHHAPKRVMIVGGGDGGILREVLKHPVEAVDLVELDPKVIDVSVEFLPSLNDEGGAFKDSRTTVYIEDAFHFLAECEPNHYDVIIVDSPDPVGEAEKLFSLHFYQLATKALAPNGIITTQSGVAFFQSGEITNTLQHFRECGLSATTYTTVVPSYYGGYMMLGYATKSHASTFPSIEDIRKSYSRISQETRHYTPELHIASFTLPKWIQELIEEDSLVQQVAI